MTLVMKKGAEVFIHHPERETDDDPNQTEKPCVQGRDEKPGPDGQNFTFPGPLMSAKMQKEELMRFIQAKCQDSLLHLDQPEQQFSYFFWSIMEYFCKGNGRVMMSEISLLLFKGYSLLRRKLNCLENQEDWCLPLARLLCSNAPEDQHREAIVEMGDDFASKGWTHGAHICYVLGKVALGSRPKFSLIGLNSSILPENDADAKETIQRTEVYEYVLSLTSGCSQLKFQRFKFAYAFLLSEDGFEARAFEYCEIIATTVLKFPKDIESSLLECILLLTQNLLHGKNQEKPEWLIKIHQLLEATAAPSKPADKPKPPKPKPQELDLPYDHEFMSRYDLGKLLGKGGFGAVYAAVRKADGKQVALKLMKKCLDDYITIPGETCKLPLEVALLQMMSKPPRCKNVIELLEWFDTPDLVILVLERPVPCMDLHEFFKLYEVDEPVARYVMRQLVQAVHECSVRRVCHRDIKLENVLINPDTMEVKLIDFGCGALLKKKPYRLLIGTPPYWPPECYLSDKYHGNPASVWSLGVFLFKFLTGRFPFDNEDEVIEGHLKFGPGLSEACRNLIEQCLQKDPKSRPCFTQILGHRWFKEEHRDTDQTPPGE